MNNLSIEAMGNLLQAEYDAYVTDCRGDGMAEGDEFTFTEWLVFGTLEQRAQVRNVIADQVCELLEVRDWLDGVSMRAGNGGADKDLGRRRMIGRLAGAVELLNAFVSQHEAPFDPLDAGAAVVVANDDDGYFGTVKRLDGVIYAIDLAPGITIYAPYWRVRLATAEEIGS